MRHNHCALADPDTGRLCDADGHTDPDRGSPVSYTHLDYALTITPDVLRTIGCRQVDQRQTRFRLRKACEEIMAADPRYISMTIDKSARCRKSRPMGEEEAAYVLTVKRRRGVRGGAVRPCLPTPGGAGAALSAAS